MYIFISRKNVELQKYNDDDDDDNEVYIQQSMTFQLSVIWLKYRYNS
jgi:hypothetical protein